MTPISDRLARASSLSSGRAAPSSVETPNLFVYGTLILDKVVTALIDRVPAHEATTACPFTGEPWRHAVAGVGSQGLPVRALWMASIGRMWWPRALAR